MSSLERIASLIGLLVASICCALVDANDVVVQLHVNRPFNDVNEKFVSFTIKPEELYKALDGPNRKSMTRMAAMLGDSYVKFVGEYYFAASSEIKLRNPTKVIWKGFNRWSRAVNWTMIIPVPYSANSWDPMVALKILNTSHTIGITDCIWQLGTDFSSSKAQEYVAELNTLNIMVDSFKPYVDSWKVMGADISAGSNAEETRRYIELSKDINEAYGWTQPAEITPSNRVSNIHDRDPALRILLNKKVPVWLSLPQRNIKPKQINNRFTVEETSNAFRWAQTLGEAASTGFDAVFKKITIADMERPSYSFYVTALYKKVMGSRVFPARPLNVFSKNNKLYTHCANDVSGGIAFMVVNNDERSMVITVRSMTKFADSELWQYSLTQKKGIILLNNERVALNSTLSPQVKITSSDQPMQLTTPGMSVSFWVLPNANLEHCQFTEVEAEEAGTESTEKEKRYSSRDRLLKKLIQETSLTNSIFSRPINRRRRYATFADRPKRFILDESEKVNDFNVGFKKLFEAPAADPTPVEKSIKKREEETSQNMRETPQSMREAALSWLKQFVPSSVKAELPLLRREVRSVDDDFFGPFFATKDGRKTAFTRKITEIKKPEKKVKPIFDQEEFDEEEFFKNIGEQQEPEYTRLPEGDVHLKHITNAEGDDVEDFHIEKRKPTKKKSIISKAVESKEAKSEMKPLRLLPTEFYEALPQRNGFKTGPAKLGFGGALNSLLFPEPFSKQSMKNKNTFDKQKEEKQNSDSISEVEEPGTGKFHKGTQLAKDFLKAQKELGRTFLNDDIDEDDEKKKKDDYLTETNENSEKLAMTDEQAKRYADYFAENIDNYFAEKDELDEEKELKNTDSAREEYKEVPWWDLSSLRRRRSPRALQINIPDEAWQNNVIDKENYDLKTTKILENDTNFLVGENSITNIATKQNDILIVSTTENNFPDKLVAKVKQKVTSFMDIMSKHINDWYNTLTKHIEVDAEKK